MRPPGAPRWWMSAVAVGAPGRGVLLVARRTTYDLGRRGLGLAAEHPRSWGTAAPPVLRDERVTRAAACRNPSARARAGRAARPLASNPAAWLLSRAGRTLSASASSR